MTLDRDDVRNRPDGLLRGDPDSPAARVALHTAIWFTKIADSFASYARVK